MFSFLFLSDISIRIFYLFLFFFVNFWFQYSVTESLHTDSDAQFYVQHLIRKLGSEAYIGQRAILSVSERISVLAESLLFLDPFDDSFSNTHECMFKL
jgi:hypothetical protein